MNNEPSSIARRDFLRACALTGVGLACGFPHHPARAASSEPPLGRIVVGLEIGASKVCAAVAEHLPGGTIKILGIGQSQSRGMGRAAMLDFEATDRCVREALADAEAKADVMIRRVVLAVKGAPGGSFSSAPQHDTHPCGREDIGYAHRGHGRLRRLRSEECMGESGWPMLAGAGPRIQNSIQCVESVGVAVDGLIYAPVASAEAVLDANQKKLGALVIDMGDSTTDYAVYADGALRQNGCVMFGSRDIREEFASQLRLPFASGEKLIIEEGSVRLGQSPSGERLVVAAGPGSTSREIERETLNTIVRQSVRRAFRSVKHDLQCSGLRLDSLRAGLHLTGGCSLLPGICELAEEVFGIPAARARVTGISTAASILENPRSSGALGLVKFAAGIEA